MTITKSEGDKLIKHAKLPFGCDQGNPAYSHISFYSDGALPIATIEEYGVAEKVAHKYGLKVVHQDFGKGEGMHPEYKTVFVAISHDVDSARSAEERIRKAEKELEQQLGI